MTVHSSTQNPSEIQAVVAHCLGLRQNQVVCTCTRMGGGFGGKESQAAHPALLAALVAHKTGRPARIVYPRDLDMRVTGKRHPYLSRYKVGFSSDGRIEALALDLYSDGGCAADLSLAVMDRSLFHADNAYFIPNCRRHRHRVPDQSAVEYGDARLRRAAGDRGDRKRDRGDRRLPGPRSLRRAPAELLRRRRPRHDALRPGGGQQHAAASCSTGSPRRPITPPPRRDRSIQRRLAHRSPRAGADAGQVRDLVHPASAQPGKCTCQHLSRRHDPGLDGRDRDGPGTQHQDPPDRRRPSLRCRSRPSG